MNSLSTKEIESQLFFLSKEALKHIVLESKCGITGSLKNTKKILSNNDINILKDFSPLLCIYKKAHPKVYSSKHTKGWEEDSFKKEILCSSNAFMTLCILELTEYYDKFKEINDKLYSFSSLYKISAKLQLDFYSSYLRNTEGVFVNKKISSDSVDNDYSLAEKEKRFKFSDQAFMMVCYYLYSKICDTDEYAYDFKNFSLDILNMFINYKNEIYNLSFEECCKLCFAFNCMYKYSENEECKSFLIDISEFLISKAEESSLIFNDLENSSLMSINLLLSYKNTGIIAFKDAFEEITEIHKKLYNSEKGIFVKNSDKKECKYSSLEIINYYLNMHLYNSNIESSKDLQSMLTNLYKHFFVNSGMVLSWPEAPSLDSLERYKNFSLKSDDLLEEIMFRMPTVVAPEVTGMAPIFTKSITYSKKKEIFTTPKSTFDSSKNMMAFYMILFLFKENYLNSIINDKFQVICEEKYNSTTEKCPCSSENTTNEATEILTDTSSIKDCSN
jgi:hypothetical protein